MTASPDETLRATAERPSVYVASRVKHADMWKAIRAANECVVVSTWIDEAGEGETANLSELWERVLSEVSQADALILYVERDDFPLKGALVEVGAALALGKAVHVVLQDVELEPRSMRPVGSWLHHPNVRRFNSVATAIAGPFYDSRDYPRLSAEAEGKGADAYDHLVTLQSAALTQAAPPQAAMPTRDEQCLKLLRSTSTNEWPWSAMAWPEEATAFAYKIVDALFPTPTRQGPT